MLRAEAFAFATRADLFDSWSAWATAAGEHVGTRSRFLDALEARGFEPSRPKGGSRGFRGLRILPKPTTPIGAIDEESEVLPNFRQVQFWMGNEGEGEDIAPIFFREEGELGVK